MNNNAIVFPEPNKELICHMMESEDEELNTLSALTVVRSKKELEDLKLAVTKIILREKGNTLGSEIQRIFREYSMIYSTF